MIRTSLGLHSLCAGTHQGPGLLLAGPSLPLPSVAVPLPPYLVLLGCRRFFDGTPTQQIAVSEGPTHTAPNVNVSWGISLSDGVHFSENPMFGQGQFEWAILAMGQHLFCSFAMAVSPSPC